MTNLRSLCTFIVTSALLATMVGIASTFRQTHAAADAPATNDQVKALFEEKCSACHDAPDPEEKGFTKEEWQTTVNRMLNAHNARNSISDPQAALIVNYLGQFAPKPGQDKPDGGDIGVWEYDPTVSVSYPFTYPPNLENFDISGGAWRIIPGIDPGSGYLKHVSAKPSPSVLLENKTAVQGALDLQVQFHVTQSSPTSAIGLVFAATDSRDYLSAAYTPSTGAVTLSKVTGNQPAVLDQSTFTSSVASLPDGWHTLRVKVTEGGTALEVLMDYQQLIKTTDPSWAGGRVGLLSTGPLIAGFRQLTIDSYQSSAPSPAGDVLLH